ncbi:MAG: molybdenum cofactor guanylyltransferase [Caulobacterales bacterium]
MASLFAARTAGVVLAGGRSRRFGSDKAAAMLAGRPLLDWTLARLDGFCAEVAVAAPAESDAGELASALSRVLLTDAPGHPEGPLAGVAAGLVWAAARGFEVLATLPCDAPLVTDEVFDRLFAALEGAGGAYAVTADGPQGLVALWRTDQAETLLRRLAAGEHPPVREALAAADGRAVMFEDAALFRNLNTPEDLATAEAALARQPP